LSINERIAKKERPVVRIKDVFSRAGRTILVIAISVLAIALVWSAIYARAYRHASPDSPSSFSKEDIADHASTAMPRGQWDAQVSAAIAANCVFEGMTKDQVEQALGKPAESDLPYWPYWREDKNVCLAYNKDTCIDYQKYEATIFFSTKGNAKEVIGAEVSYPKTLPTSCYRVSYPDVVASGNARLP
jgi:hypothetical protein